MPEVVVAVVAAVAPAWPLAAAVLAAEPSVAAVCGSRPRRCQ